MKIGRIRYLAFRVLTCHRLPTYFSVLDDCDSLIAINLNDFQGSRFALLPIATTTTCQKWQDKDANGEVERPVSFHR